MDGDFQLKDDVALVPVGILLNEAANDRIIVSGPEVVGSSFLVVILPGVAEGIGVFLSDQVSTIIIIQFCLNVNSECGFIGKLLIGIGLCLPDLSRCRQELCAN